MTPGGRGATGGWSDARRYARLTYSLAGTPLLASCIPSPRPRRTTCSATRTRPAACGVPQRANLQIDERGLAQVYGDQHAPLTTDGEAFDRAQWPPPARRCRCPRRPADQPQTGRQVLVRINDRGPPTPRRMLAVTRRVAQLLGFPPDGVAQVRLEVLEGDSLAAQAGVPGAPALPITAAPRGAVQAASLPPPPGARGSAGGAGVLEAESRPRRRPVPRQPCGCPRP